MLDRALRPGRFDRRVIVNLPDRNGREAILKVHAQVPLAKTSSSTSSPGDPGFSGADLKNLVNRLAGRAAHRRKSSRTDFGDALEKIVLARSGRCS